LIVGTMTEDTSEPIVDVEQTLTEFDGDALDLLRIGQAG
jgi:hypothetical protein